MQCAAAFGSLSMWLIWQLVFGKSMCFFFSLNSLLVDCLDGRLFSPYDHFRLCVGRHIRMMHKQKHFESVCYGSVDFTSQV